MALDGVAGTVNSVLHTVMPYIIWFIIIVAAIYYFFVIRERLGYGR